MPGDIVICKAPKSELARHDPPDQEMQASIAERRLIHRQDAGEVSGLCKPQIDSDDVNPSTGGP